MHTVIMSNMPSITKRCDWPDPGLLGGGATAENKMSWLIPPISRLDKNTHSLQTLIRLEIIADTCGLTFLTKT